MMRLGRTRVRLAVAGRGLAPARCLGQTPPPKGVQQSPVNLELELVRNMAARTKGDKDGKKPPLEGIYYGKGAVPGLKIKSSSDHYATELEVKGAGLNGLYVVDSAGKYIVKAFHFHTRGEHQLSGLAPDVELHIVHQPADAHCYDDLVVFSVLFEARPDGDRGSPGEGPGHAAKGAAPPSPHENPFLVSCGWRCLPKIGECERAFDTADFGLLNALRGRYVAYDGSLTTGKHALPTCPRDYPLPSEVPVKWRVFRDVEVMSYSQLRAMQAALSGLTPQGCPDDSWHGNWRAVQPFDSTQATLFPPAAFK